MYIGIHYTNKKCVCAHMCAHTYTLFSLGLSFLFLCYSYFLFLLYFLYLNSIDTYIKTVCIISCFIMLHVKEGMKRIPIPQWLTNEITFNI